MASCLIKHRDNFTFTLRLLFLFKDSEMISMPMEPKRRICDVQRKQADIQDIVMYRPITKRWLFKQWSLLGNVRNILTQH
jgi:hypothetical protein